MGQEESTNVKELGVVDVGLDFGSLEVIDREGFGGLKVCAEGSGRARRAR